MVQAFAHRDRPLETMASKKRKNNTQLCAQETNKRGRLPVGFLIKHHPPNKLWHREPFKRQKKQQLSKSLSSRTTPPIKKNTAAGAHHTKNTSTAHQQLVVQAAGRKGCVASASVRYVLTWRARGRPEAKAGPVTLLELVVGDSCFWRWASTKVLGIDK